jgi:hypothetical protein
MDASTLNMGAIAGGGRVVDSEAQGAFARPTHQGLEGGTEQTVAERIGTTASSPESGVGAAEVNVDAGRTEPGGNGASSFGEEGTDKKQE